MICNKSDNDSIQKTVNALKQNKVVIVPTDTVYGFSGLIEVTNDKIKKIKGRDENKPFIVLISCPEDIKKITDSNIPLELLNFWPGALTIIVNDKNNKSIAVRCPGDKWLRDVIKESGFIYSTSVNRSGNPVLSNIDDIINEFEKEVELIVLDGNKEGAKPSTIVSLLNNRIEVIREGEIKINNI